MNLISWLDCKLDCDDQSYWCNNKNITFADDDDELTCNQGC